MSNSVRNGETTIDTAGMDTQSKLDLILEGQVRLEEKFDEVIEKLSNLSLPGSDFELDDL